MEIRINDSRIMNDILKAVQTVSWEKAARNIVPSYATLIEVMALCPEIPIDSIKKEIEELESQGTVITGHTVNDIFIQLKDSRDYDGKGQAIVAESEEHELGR